MAHEISTKIYNVTMCYNTNKQMPLKVWFFKFLSANSKIFLKRPCAHSDQNNSLHTMLVEQELYGGVTRHYNSLRYGTYICHWIDPLYGIET